MATTEQLSTFPNAVPPATMKNNLNNENDGHVVADIDEWRVKLKLE